MKSKVNRGVRMFGPYLINRDLEKYKISSNEILTEGEGIYAEKLTKASRSTLEFFSLGENKNACVFFTPIPPNVKEVMSGLNKYIGWEGKKLAVKMVFEVSKGVVTTHDASLIKDKFPSVSEYLEGHVKNKI